MESIYKQMNKIDDNKSLNEKYNVKDEKELKKLQESMKEGLFDYIDDEYFTRDEVNEFAEKVCDHVNETFNEKFEVQESYITDNLIEVVLYNDELGEFVGSKKIDMRRIRKPSDLNKYVLNIAANIIEQVKEVIIDSDYYDASEDELRKMGAFDNLNESIDKNILKFKMTSDVDGLDETNLVCDELIEWGVQYQDAKKRAGTYIVTIIGDEEQLKRAKLAIERIRFFKEWVNNKMNAETDGDMKEDFETDGSVMTDYGFESGENDMNDLYFYKEDADDVVVTVHGNDALKGVKCPDAGKVIKRPTKVTLTDGDEETVLGFVTAEYKISTFGNYYVLNDARIDDKVWKVLNDYLKTSRNNAEKYLKVQSMKESFEMAAGGDDFDGEIAAMRAEQKDHEARRAARKERFALMHKLFDTHIDVEPDANWVDKVYHIFDTAKSITFVGDKYKTIPGRTKDKQPIKYRYSIKEYDFYTDPYGEIVYIATNNSKHDSSINDLTETYWINNKDVMMQIKKLGDELEADGFEYYGDRYSGSEYYIFYTKIDNGNAICKAIQYNYDGAQVIDVTVDQVSGYKPIDSFEKMRRELGNILLPQHDDELNENTSTDNYKGYIHENVEQYDKDDGWTEEDIKLHKNTDWAARNYMDLPIPEDNFIGVATAYTDNGVQRVKCKFIKFIRANSIYPPYYAPENEPFKNVVGPMYDGNKYKTYDKHDRYESQDIYDSLSR